MPRKATKQTRQAPPKSKGGADKQTLFKTEYIAQAAKLAAQGWTRMEISAFFDVSDRTFRRWCERHPELEKALLIPEEAANKRAIMSLFLQTVGYERDEEEIKVIEGKVVRVKIKRYYPPNASASIFWAKAKAGLRDNEPLTPPVPADDGGTTIDETGNETDRQVARKFLYLVEKEKRKA